MLLNSKYIRDKYPNFINTLLEYDKVNTTTHDQFILNQLLKNDFIYSPIGYGQYYNCAILKNKNYTFKLLSKKRSIHIYSSIKI
jgi:lipopolysaccharide biosynthesis glycosyltransferase